MTTSIAPKANLIVNEPSSADTYSAEVRTQTEESLHALLQERFGYTDFLPGQLRVIRHLVDGQSTAAVFPTGGGKSLCYQLPALLFEGVTLIVSPLIALMKDQIDALEKRGIAAARLDSTLDHDEYRAVISNLRNGSLRALYVAPERFNNERFREMISHTHVSLFAVDEAHCVSEWGHAFRPDYLKLARFAKELGVGRILALTATATPTVLDDICEEFGIAGECAVRTGFYRPNLRLAATPVTPKSRDGVLIQRLKEQPAGATIVYVTLQKTAMELAKRLNDAGLEARPYHAGLAKEVRAESQDWFLTSDTAVIVATIAFGMGIDKSAIRYVYHYNLPKSLENYAQEIGRAGRDGESSTCEALVCQDDLRVLENFVYGDTPERTAIAGLVHDIFTREDYFSVSVYQLSQTYDIRDLIVRILLTYLDLDGFIQGGTPRYNEYRFKPLTDSSTILNHFQGERREFVAGIFKQSQKSKVWFHLDVDHTAQLLHCDRSRVIRALDYLSDRGWLELRSSKVMHVYQIRKRPDDLAELVDTLHGRCQHRLDMGLDRLQQQLRWFEHNACQTNALAAHFGEQRNEDCGHCQWCHERSPIKLNAPQHVMIEDSDWQHAIDFRKHHQGTLRSPMLFARFLCGIRSPQLAKHKLLSDPSFGRFSHVPFADVLDRIRADES